MKQQPKRNIRFMLDTNVLIDLEEFSSSEQDYKEKFKSNLKHFFEIKTLDEVLCEDMDKGRDSEIFLSIPSVVADELLKGYSTYSGKACKMLRKFEINATRDSGVSEELSKNIYFLLQGKNRFCPQFSDNLFDFTEKNDCRVIASSIVNNQPVLTSNINHFAGVDGELEQEILERVETYSKLPYVQRNYDLQFNKYSAYSISRFLEEFFPEKYSNMQTLIAKTKPVQGEGGRE